MNKPNMPKLQVQNVKDVIYDCVAMCQTVSSQYLSEAEATRGDIETTRHLYGAAQGALRCAAKLLQAAHEVE